VKSAVKVIVALLVLVGSVQAGAQGISEPVVRSFLAKFDKAIAAKNAAEIGRYISDDVQISSTMTSRGATQSHKMNKDQYMTALRNNWSMSTNYVYRRSNEIIAVSGNAATVSADVFESMVMGGQYISGRSTQVATIELVKGTPMITKIVARGSM